jgi:acyl-CoA reductase-like NAD-dependent aldehyde dehydrogenase
VFAASKNDISWTFNYLVALQEWRREGNLIWPILIDHVRPDMRIAWEEPFGPILPCIRIKTVEEGIHHCNANNFALQVTISSLTFSNPISFFTR